MALLAISAALGYAAWKGLTQPPGPRSAPARRAAPPNDSLAFVAVAGEGIDIEVVAPDGQRTSTVGGRDAGRIPGSEAAVDCPGFSDPGGSDAMCTASVNVSNPAPGEYTVIARAATHRAITMNVGWATASQVKRGGFDVRVQIAPGGATAFTIAVARDAVNQRSEPRPLSP